MMGQISGSTDNLKDLKELLTLVGDPKKSLQAVNDLQSQLAGLEKAKAEKEELDKAVSEKLKQAEKLSQIAEAKLESHNKLVGNLELSQKNFYDNMARFDQQKAELAAAKKKLQTDVSAHNECVTRTIAELDARAIRLAALQVEAETAKVKYETKIAKIEAAAKA